MRNYEFTYENVPDTLPYRVQRSAVLYPLTKMCQSKEEMREQTERLVGMWRARVASLEDAGCSFFQGVNSVYAKNCYPAFVFASPRTRCCNRTTICPFCYARWVRSVWERIDAAFPPADPETGEFPYHLATWKQDWTDVLDEDEDTAGWLYRQMEELDNVRKLVARGLKVPGFFFFVTIAPTEAGWKVRQRHLLKIDAKQAMPDPYIQNATKCSRYIRPTRKNILNAVATVCRYPPSLIQDENPAKTMTFLEVRRERNFRTSWAYGDFRGRRFNSKERKKS